MKQFFNYYQNVFERPLKVYAEMYGRACDYTIKKEASAKNGMLISLAVAFFIVVFSASSFRLAEQSIKRAFNFESAHLSAPSVAPLDQTSFGQVIQLKTLRNEILQYVADGSRLLLGIQTASAASASYAANLSTAPPSLELMPGERQLVRLKYINEGTYNWRQKGRSFISLYFRMAGKKISAMHDSSWIDLKQIARINDVLVGPGRMGFIEFYVRAPKKVGTYKEKFMLAAEDTAWVEGSEVAITMHVVKEKSKKISETQSTSTLQEIQPFSVNLWMDGEMVISTSTPVIRVGLYRSDEPVEFISDNEYEIRDGNGELYGQIRAGQVITFKYDASQKIYIALSENEYASSTLPLRLLPREEIFNVFTLKNALNFKGNNKKINYNQFHGILEARYTDGHLWVINELNIEEYLQGLAESSPGSPIEFQKALAIAARSYAYTHIQNPTKHTRVGFTVDAEYDQIYKGVMREQMNPEWLKAVNDTRGTVVTYLGQTVITPYFAQSNGRTKSFFEVWGADKPWLLPVKAQYDKGRKRLGHGVGMSTHDAYARAKSGAKAEEILKYYYTGTETQTLW